MRPTISGMVEDELRSLVEVFTTDANPGGKTVALDRSEWDLAGLGIEVMKVMPLPKGRTPNLGAR